MKTLLFTLLSLFLINNSFSYTNNTTNDTIKNTWISQNKKDSIVLCFNYLSVLNKRNKVKKKNQIKSCLIMTENHIKVHWPNQSHHYEILKITKIYINDKILYHLMLYDSKNNELIKMISYSEKKLILMEFKNQKITILLY